MFESHLSLKKDLQRNIYNQKVKEMASKDQQINQLMEMGFGNNRVVRALQATGFKVSLDDVLD